MSPKRSKLKRRLRAFPPAGTLVGIPLLDGRYLLAQVAGYYIENNDPCNPVCAIYDKILMPKEPVDSESHLGKLMSVVTTIGFGILYQTWPIVGAISNIDLLAMKTVTRNQTDEMVGVTVSGENIIETFANALVGLAPWNHYLDPEFFDKKLFPGVSRPANAFFAKK